MRAEQWILLAPPASLAVGELRQPYPLLRAASQARGRGQAE